MTARAKLDVKPPSLFTLIVLIAFAAINAVLYTPALPSIQETFSVSSADIKLTMTVFLLGYAVGQLIYGPIANQLGRKKTLYIGISITFIGSVIAALAGPCTSFSLLMWGRIIAALGSSVGLMMALTIISDYYYEVDARRIISYVTFGFAAVPGVSIALGGILANWLGWESIFYALVLYSLFVFFLVLRLPETATQLHANAIHLRQIVHRYFHVLRDPNLLRYAVMAGLGTGTVYLFYTAAPFIAINRLMMTEWQYGLCVIIPSAGFVLGGVLGGQLAHRFSARGVILSGILVTAVGVALFSAFFLAGLISLETLFSPFALVFLGIPMVYSNASALATAQSDDKPTAAALISFINVGISVCAVLLFGFVATMPGEALPYFVLALLAGVIVLFVSSRLK